MVPCTEGQWTGSSHQDRNFKKKKLITIFGDPIVSQ